MTSLQTCCPTPSQDPGTLIRIDSLSLHYGQRTVLRDVSLTVRTAEITALIGPSGCGKTSLLCAINRMTDLLPQCRVEGRVIVDGLDIHAADTDVVALRRRIGMIFQKPNPFPLSIRRNIELPLREHGMRDRDAIDATVQKSLEDVGLWSEIADRLDASALSLSGGQQQRLCIARALALRPDAIMFDEPCSALDPISSGVVEDLIAGLRGRLTVIIVTHNLAQARRIADSAAMVWCHDGAGKIVECGDCRQMFEEPCNPLTAAYVRGERG